jgi:organic hydroperoxide reductase OsmC/OhrA
VGSQPFPHHYHATSSAEGESLVPTISPGLKAIDTGPPPEFGGSGQEWSPETLFPATISSCLVLTFRSVARASKVEWKTIEVHTEGVLDRVDKVNRFTEFTINVTLVVPEGQDAHRAERAVEKSDKICLITNSINAEFKLNTTVETG